MYVHTILRFQRSQLDNYLKFSSSPSVGKVQQTQAESKGIYFTSGVTKNLKGLFLKREVTLFS